MEQKQNQKKTQIQILIYDQDNSDAATQNGNRSLIQSQNDSKFHIKGLKPTESNEIYLRTDPNDYGFIPYLSERDRLGNLIIPEKEAERREQVLQQRLSNLPSSISPQQLVNLAPITNSHSQLNSHRKSYNGEYFFTNNYNNHNKTCEIFKTPLQNTSVSTQSQTKIQKKLKNMPYNDHKQNPKSLIKTIAGANYSSQLSESKQSLHFNNNNFSLSNLDLAHKEYGAIDYRKNGSWVSRYQVSEIAHIQGTHRSFNTSFQSRSFKDKETRIKRYQENKQKIEYPDVGFYENTDSILNQKSPMAFTFKKNNLGKQQIIKTPCKTDYYDINDHILHIKEQKKFSADLEIGSYDRFNPKGRREPPSKTQNTNQDEKQIENQIEFMRSVNQKYSLNKFQPPVNYVLQWDINRRPTMEEMHTDWESKIQQYGYKLGKKGVNKLFTQTMDLKGKQKKKK